MEEIKESARKPQAYEIITTLPAGTVSATGCFYYSRFGVFRRCMICPFSSLRGSLSSSLRQDRPGRYGSLSLALQTSGTSKGLNLSFCVPVSLK